MNKMVEFDKLLNRLCEIVVTTDACEEFSLDSPKWALRILYDKALCEIEELRKLKKCDNCANGPMRRCLYWVDCIHGASIGAIEDKWLGEGAEIDCGTIIEE